MKKSVYFIIQIIWSLILSSVIWYLLLKNAGFDFYGNSGSSVTGVIIVIGFALYMVLTIVQIVIGARKVKNWHWWIIPVSLAVGAATAFLGLFVTVYSTEFLNKAFALGL